MKRTPAVTHTRIAIVGSRAFAAEWKVRKYVADLVGNVSVVSGGADGVDTWAEDEANHLGIETKVFPAEWESYGRSAGYRRNAIIVANCDRVVAFWDGVSKGTKHTIDLALASCVDLEVHFA